MARTVDSRRRGLLAALAAAGALAGCGFTLRRYDGMPFASIHIDAPTGNVAAERLRRALLRESGLQLRDRAEDAEVTLTLSGESRRRTILSLSGAGRVKEFRLDYKIGYSLKGSGAIQGFPTELIELTRDYTYDDAQLLAKAAEEQRLYRDMEDDAVRRILRRLSSLSRT